MRKLVTVRRIADIQPIDGADAIERVTLDGWHCVAKKGEFQIGDLAIYAEVDAFLPADDERFAFLKKSGVNKDPSGFERMRIRTVRLRGQVSQGIALPIALFPEFIDEPEGADVSERLNVIKYERPEPKCTNAAGNFPEWLRKSDEERIQNIFKRIQREHDGDEFYATLKMDGSSMTVAFIPYSHPIARELSSEKALATDDGYFVVCSRNLMLKPDENSHFWKAFNRESLGSLLPGLNSSRAIAVQGECVGPGINGGKELFTEFRYFMFNVFDIDHREYWPWTTANDALSRCGIPVVPTLGTVVPSQLSVDELLAYADGPSINNDNREGIVFKLARTDVRPVSFKVISNRFLLEHKE